MQEESVGLEGYRFMSHNLITRTLALLVMIPIVVAIIFLPIWVRSVVLALISALSFYEFFQMARYRVVYESAGGKRLVGFGSLYLLGSLSALAYLVINSTASQLLWFFSVVWATDIAAYLVGRSLGGVKLAPKISPNKTWSGFLGGILGGVLVSEIFQIAQAPETFHISLPLVLLICVSVHGGDLLESWAKRYCGVKDSGHIIPGHGGILDRMDGLLAAALVYTTLLMLPDWF